jgi:hypothetical protein
MTYTTKEILVGYSLYKLLKGLSVGCGGIVTSSLQNMLTSALKFSLTQSYLLCRQYGINFKFTLRGSLSVLVVYFILRCGFRPKWTSSGA